MSAAERTFYALCDRCRVQAYVMVTVHGVDLAFCGHHYAEHELALLPVATKVVDEREFLSYNPLTEEVIPGKAGAR